MNVNRTSIEGTLGVDLLYYNHVHEAFTLVQYKRLGDGGYYPSSDGSYSKELARMMEVEAGSSRMSEDARSLRGYRMHEGLCYLKFCDTVTFSPLSNSLITGLYVPLDYWNLVSSVGPRTKRGAFLVDRTSLQRHLDNVIFCRLVADGWIGICAVTKSSGPLALRPTD
jgi:hypothetical protein